MGGGDKGEVKHCISVTKWPHTNLHKSVSKQLIIIVLNHSSCTGLASLVERNLFLFNVILLISGNQ